MKMSGIASCALGVLLTSSAVSHDARNSDRNSAGELDATRPRS
jgi:hypothetical protein